jgi:hypothetical protein
LSRRSLEDLFWIGSIFGILTPDIVIQITSLSQPGVLRTMPPEMYQKHISVIRDTLLKKLEEQEPT